jgi:hypothetical protein
MKSLSPRGNQVITATKVLLLVAAVWGLAYPALLWGLGRVIPS